MCKNSRHQTRVNVSKKIPDFPRDRCNNQVSYTRDKQLHLQAGYSNTTIPDLQL